MSVNTAIAGAPHEQQHKHGAPGHSGYRADWYILRVGAGLDFEADKALRNAGWSTFLPREPKWRPGHYRRRCSPSDYPRFPGYLFLATAPPSWPAWADWPWRNLLHGVLCMSGRPIRLADGEIERLMADDGRPVPHRHSVPVHRAFMAGDQVRVRSGAWRDWVVHIDAIDDKGAHISVPLFGRQVETVLPLTWLEAA